MLETLLRILAVDCRAPEIILEEDGDICLDWDGETTISIAPSGMVAWAIMGNKHGTDLECFLEILKTTTT